MARVINFLIGFGIVVIILIVIGLAHLAYANPEPMQELQLGVRGIGSGIYVFDIQKAMSSPNIDGWAPMLKEFMDKNPDLEIVAIAPAHASGNRGTINSMLVVTKHK